MAVLWRVWQRYQWMRFLAVGGMNTAFSYGIYSGLIFMGVNFAISNLVSLILGIFFSFYTQSSVVFRNSDRRVFVRYVAMWAGLYFLNTMIIGSLIKLGASAYGAGALAIFPITALSFFLQKYFIFAAAKQK